MQQRKEMTAAQIAARRHMRWKQFVWIYRRGAWIKHWIR